MKERKKKQHRRQSIDTLVGGLDCLQETSRKRIAGGSDQDTAGITNSYQQRLYRSLFSLLRFVDIR